MHKKVTNFKAGIVKLSSQENRLYISDSVATQVL